MSAGRYLIAVDGETAVYRPLAEDLDTGSNSLFTKIAGRICPRLAAWHDFEFLRDGRILLEICDRFKSGIIDKAACIKYVQDVKEYRYPYELYDAQNELMAAYTAETLLE